VRAIAWESHGEPGEIESLRAGLADLEGSIATEAWAERKGGLLAEIAQTGFWQRDDRFDVLGRAEYMDRVEAGLRSARSLFARLEGESRARASFPRPLLRRLAQQQQLLALAAGEALASGPRDAFVALEAGPDAGDDAAARAWRDRLAAMYESWARARGMRVQELEPARAAGGRGMPARWLAVSGFGSLATLEPEEGLHLFEQGTQAAGAGRVSVRVRVAAQPARPARGPEELALQAAQALGAAGSPPAIVRRYREDPSPLARDFVRGWRTGRVERVLAGDFDVVPAGEAGEGGA
jgi:ATP-dependent Clp protease ATP-binding subunit ClpC